MQASIKHGKCEAAALQVQGSTQRETKREKRKTR